MIIINRIKLFLKISKIFMLYTLKYNIIYVYKILIYNIKYNWLFIFILFVTPLFVLSVNSWFCIWVNIELNLIVFIIYLMLNNIYIYDLCIKYFLVNSFRSILFIFISNFIIFNLNNYIFISLINLSIILKLGIIPFHFWFIDIIKRLNWIRCFVLSTWQKIIPFFILRYIYIQNLILIFIFIRSIFRIIFSINQIYLKKIYAYSSINHMCWLIISIFLRELIWIIYFFSYLIINLLLIIILKIYNVNYLIDLYYKFNNKCIIFFFIILLFSLGGIPPFLGFIIKWYLIYYLIERYNFFILIILIFFSLIFLFFYLRIIYKNIFLNIINFNLLKYINVLKLNFLIFLCCLIIRVLSLFIIIIYI